MKEIKTGNTTPNGLQQKDIASLQKQYGKNSLRQENDYRLARIILHIVTEPMFLLLLAAAGIYFLLGSYSEGWLMITAIGLVSFISFYQEEKSSRAIRSLKQLTDPLITVIRDQKETAISTEDIVPGDIFLISEGMQVPADATVLQSNDLTVNESVMTGESLPVEKNTETGHQLLLQGTLISSGKCMALVIATGKNTQLGKLGKSIDSYKFPKTALQKQINGVVNKLAVFGLLASLVIFVINYLHEPSLTKSILLSLTVAMSVLPEEIPVAFASFMALGSLRLSRFGIISRTPQVVENLGALTCICLDKTGTITENNMKLVAIYDAVENRDIGYGEDNATIPSDVLYFAALASETDPFDPMEKAILSSFHLAYPAMDRKQFSMTGEYPLEPGRPMMTHLFTINSQITAAAKGSPEIILQVCKLSPDTTQYLTNKAKALASKGYRVLGVAHAVLNSQIIPGNQEEFEWKFNGLLALYDPPKKNAAAVIRQLTNAGLSIKLLTGDFPETARTIAAMVGISNSGGLCTGKEVMKMNDTELAQMLRTTHVFARMFPEAKMRVIKQLQAVKETVAMTGDGVNDGPALKAADVGIAMGKKGSELARWSADLVLSDDNLDRLLVAIENGRRIFMNIKKAIRYIITIHIPVILIASLPLLLGWKFPNIFTPVHVIFLELIMGPTCSLFFEREPAESDLMHAPATSSRRVIPSKQLWMIILQGLLITAGVLTLYYFSMHKGDAIDKTRSLVFNTLLFANLLLTFSLRSVQQTFFQTVTYKNPLTAVILLSNIVFMILLNGINTVREMFHIQKLSFSEYLLCGAIGIISVAWFEFYKMARQKKPA